MLAFISDIMKQLFKVFYSEVIILLPFIKVYLKKYLKFSFIVKDFSRDQDLFSEIVTSGISYW